MLKILAGCCLVFSLALAACGTDITPGVLPTSSSASATRTPGPLTKITVALGFVPGVSFSPFYIAQDKGYYAAEGLELDLKYGQIDNLLPQLADGKIEFGMLSGDQVVAARTKDLAVTYVMGVYEKSPVGVVSISGNGFSLKTPAALKGRTIGVSNLSGPTYIGLKALLQAANLAEEEVKVVAVGFTEVEALTTKRIDAAMTFLPNESVQMEDLGIKTEFLTVSDYLKIVPGGITTGEKTIKERPDLVQRFVNATVRGLKETLANPDAALAMALKRVPELAPEKIPTQKRVLAATIPYYQPLPGHSQGWSDPADWKTTVEFLAAIKQTDKLIDPNSAFTNRFVDAAKP